MFGRVREKEDILVYFCFVFLFLWCSEQRSEPFVSMGF